MEIVFEKKKTKIKHTTSCDECKKKNKVALEMWYVSASAAKLSVKLNNNKKKMK